jgi:hypothetical protein
MESRMTLIVALRLLLLLTWSPAWISSGRSD